MPSKTIDQKVPANYPGSTNPDILRTAFYLNQVWSHSPRKNGVLSLEDQPHGRIKRAFHQYELKNLSGYVNMPRSPLGLSSILADYPAVHNSMQNECYQRLRGKLYYGNAALGVTLGSYKQSREMIVDRYRQLSARADKWASVLGAKHRHRQVAGFHLEVIFGWTPLLNDIHAATETVIQLADSEVNLSSKSRRAAHYQRGSLFSTVNSYDLHYKWVKTYAASVLIRNPNVWLAERAGLLNPAAVAWDLAPWSFVINMFVNTGQLVNQITDFSGLEFKKFSITNNERHVCQIWNAAPGPRPVINGVATQTVHDKQRVLTTKPPSLNLQFRVPDANWETAAMAASLFAQKFLKIARLVKQTKRGIDARGDYTE